MPVSIDGLQFTFSPTDNRLLSPSGESPKEVPELSHSNAIAFKTSSFDARVVRFYTGARDKKPDWETPQIVRSLAEHEITVLKDLSSLPNPLAVKVVETGEAGAPGKSTLFAVMQFPHWSHRVIDLIKGGNYAEFHEHMKKLAESLLAEGYNVRLKPSHAIIDIDGAQPAAKLIRAVRDDRKDGPSLGSKAIEDQLDRLKAWPGIYKDLINRDTLPELGNDAFANTPGEIARLITHAIEVQKPIWIYDDWRKGRAKNGRGKIRIVPAKESLDHDFLLDGYFLADVYTLKGELPKRKNQEKPEMFRLEYIPWASVKEPAGDSPFVTRPKSASTSALKSSESKRTVSAKTIEKRREQLAELRKASAIRTGRVFKFSKYDPVEIMNILQHLHASGAEFRMFYAAGRRVSERAKKEAEPAKKARIRLDQFTGRITSVTKLSNNQYLFRLQPSERITMKNGEPEYAYRSFNPWVGRVKEIRVLDANPPKPDGNIEKR